MEARFWVGCRSSADDSEVALAAIGFAGGGSVVYQDRGWCFAYDQVSLYFGVQSVPESYDAYIVPIWEVCFDRLEFRPVGCRHSTSLLDFLEFLECYFLSIYLAERMLHAGLQFFPGQVYPSFLV